MRRACIDIGSNTTRLLVADTGGAVLVPVHEERVFTRIGVALASGDTIPEAKRAEVMDVVSAQLAVARSLGAREVHGVATAAIRHAADGARFAADLEARCGLALRILSDREEAHLAFAGAAGMLEGPPPEPLGVLDVGGGSSEVIVGAACGAIAWWTSLALGSGMLAHRHLAHDPPTEAELGAAREEAAAIVDEIQPPPMAAAVAVGGSATTLARLTGPRLDEPSLHAALALLVAGPSAEVALRHRIDAERARLLPAGLVILETLRARLRTELTVGRGGIREGVLLQAEMQ